MNYGELKQAIVDYAHRADLADMVPGFVKLTEGMLGRELRAAEQTTNLTLTEAERVAGGVYLMPAGFLEMRAVYFARAGVQFSLEQVSLAAIRERPSSSPVAQFAVRGRQVEFRGVPATDAEIECEYLARFVALDADGDTNDLLTNHYALYLYGGLFHLYQFTQDLELAQAALDTFRGALDMLNEQAGRQLGGASIGGGYNFGAGGGY
jgi:hypothetical protein